MITIVNYGVGNLGALLNMFDFIGQPAAATCDATAIASASRLLLPGVGAFDAAMGRLKASGVIPALEEAVLHRRVPILGVCLGMQLLGRSSEEGEIEGLGWLPARTVRMRPSAASGLKVPFMGWAQVRPSPTASLFDQRSPERFYFTHSFRMECSDPAHVAATYSYGDPVVCAVQQGNVFGVQFHPEKSHRFGMALLNRFAQGTW